MLSALLHGALDLVAPPRCPACDAVVAPGEPRFCGACEPLLEPATGAPRAALIYGGPIADAMRRYKYGGRSELAGPLGAILAGAAMALAGEVDAIVPVPLHPRRAAERGYDQAALLARPLAPALGLPLRLALLRRLRPTAPQASKSADERAKNVRGAFVARRVAPGTRILLVDDVRTTGATLEAAARALVDAGAARVEAITLARVESG